jgi:hypothetical protein
LCKGNENGESGFQKPVFSFSYLCILKLKVTSYQQVRQKIKGKGKAIPLQAWTGP